MYSQAQPLLNTIQSILATAIIPLIPGIMINIDQPIETNFNSLPTLDIFPMEESWEEDQSFNYSDYKKLSIRIELRMKSGPASNVCTPLMNVIVDTIRADNTLGGIALYVKFLKLIWANFKTESGQSCGAALEIEVEYLTKKETES